MPHSQGRSSKSIRRTGAMLWILVLLAWASPESQAAPENGAPVAPGLSAPDAQAAGRYLDAVGKFADLAVEHGRDVYGAKRTPLFVDALNVKTHEPFQWKRNGESWTMSNLASQQNLFRALVGLSLLTGDGHYKQAAVDAMQFGFKNLRGENGLLQWGGHVAYDAAGDRLVMEAYRHELKRHYPYFEFMREIDEPATYQYLRAFWAAHILDWSKLDFNRHGEYNAPLGELWDHKFGDGKVFFESKGRTFCNSGSDLIRAAVMLHLWTGEQGPLTWAERMGGLYAATRNPKTGLVGYVYSSTGDRMQQQFGPEFGDRAWESKMLDVGRGRIRIAMMGIVQLKLAAMLGDKGGKFRDWALEDLRAYAKWAYDPKTGMLHALLSDGTPLVPADVKREGYYIASEFEAQRPDGLFFWAYAMGARVDDTDACWRMTREIGRLKAGKTGTAVVRAKDVSGRLLDVERALELGDIGESPSGPRALNFETASTDAYAIFGLLELAQKTGDPAFLKVAERVADNILRERFVNGLFIQESSQVYAKFDELTPLALLHLAAALRGGTDTIPEAWPGLSYFQCPFDGMGRIKDNLVIYGKDEEGGKSE